MKRLLTALTVLGLASVASAAVPYKLGIAGWSYYRTPFKWALGITEAAGCHYLCHKDFFLPYTATDAQIAAYKADLAAHGISTFATGPLYASDEETLKKQFEFAKKLGVTTLIGVPFELGGKDGKERLESDKMLDLVEKYVKRYDMRYAIHNHGPDMPRLYPTADSVWKRIAKRDRRIGLCLDVAHHARSGGDPVAAIRMCQGRIYDVHLHNCYLGKGNGYQGARTPDGDVKLPEIMKALAEYGFDGVAHLEYSRDYDNNLLGIVESIAYLKGCMDSVKTKAWLEPTPAGANVLTEAEKKEGYELLFDGVTLPKEKWLGVSWQYRSFPEKGWYVKDGALTMRPMHLIKDDGEWGDLPPEDMKLGGGGDIVTVKKYRDFVFKFDFRMTEKANSGVKYFFDEKLDSGTCEEYQVLDSGHPDYYKGKDGNRQIAALYDIFPAPKAEAAVKPLGRWNSGMIVSKGTKVEHWLNGVKVLAYERGSAAFRAAVDRSKYATWGTDGRRWGELEKGRLLLQDHTDSTVSFCNLKVKEF